FTNIKQADCENITINPFAYKHIIVGCTISMGTCERRGSTYHGKEHHSPCFKKAIDVISIWTPKKLPAPLRRRLSWENGQKKDAVLPFVRNIRQ
ncbi:hypothetical protein LJC49_06165, partial [Ruminococcaceae bacterium OttesenSCG-928-I18]|nr:hypothetical protein [Ruminococcaceae bacterium OttesenSCG-928-I18]